MGEEDQFIPDQGDDFEQSSVIPPEPSRVEVGHIMAFISFVRVEDVESGGNTLTVRDLDDDRTYQVRGGELVRAARSADQFHEEIRVSQTEVIEKLITAYGRPFTVCFIKLDGSERVLRGRLVQPEILRGRSQVEDLDIPDRENRLRLVDHRTLQWLILDGIRYVAK